MNSQDTNQSEAEFFVFPEKPKREAPAAPVPLVAAPRWRRFAGKEIPRPQPSPETRGVGYQRLGDVALRVNTAIALRRPLLVTGNPGNGKTTLAYAIARELGLGTVLRWNITSRSTLRDALYSYDILGRLNEANLPDGAAVAADIGRFIRLGPLGTALLPVAVPRVLLIDELDKSDIDLPNDLLHVFEEGEYEIPELRREKGAGTEVKTVKVSAADGEDMVPISGGRVKCSQFPIVVITSNGEREFSPAFLRRCVRLALADPTPEELGDIARAQFEDPADLTADIKAQREKGFVATDQLLNALHLLGIEGATDGATDRRQKLIEAALEPLTRARRSASEQ